MYPFVTDVLGWDYAGVERTLVVEGVGVLGCHGG